MGRKRKRSKETDKRTTGKKKNLNSSTLLNFFEKNDNCMVEEIYGYIRGNYNVSDERFWSLYKAWRRDYMSLEYKHVRGIEKYRKTGLEDRIESKEQFINKYHKNSKLGLTKKQITALVDHLINTPNTNNANVEKRIAIYMLKELRTYEFFNKEKKWS